MINKNERLVMIGAGGHAKVCYDIAKLMGKWNEIIILDDNQTNKYFEVAGPIEHFNKYIDNSDFFVAIGDNYRRKSFTYKLVKINGNIARLIHPNAVIGSDVIINAGTVIMAGVVINSSTRVGHGCIINTSSSIDHDNVIDDYVHISPGVHLAGEVSIGRETWIGAGTTVINNVNIGSEIIIGAGSLVINDIKNKNTYYGVPIS